MPFALVGVVDEIVSVLIFVVFLTYGFVGLEFVSMQLQLPFGNGPNDLDVAGMVKAALSGINRDAQEYERAAGEDKAPCNRYAAMKLAGQIHHGQSGGSMSLADEPSNYAAGYYSMVDAGSHR